MHKKADYVHHLQYGYAFQRYFLTEIFRGLTFKKKKVRKEIIGKLCDVGHDTVNKHARKI